MDYPTFLVFLVEYRESSAIQQNRALTEHVSCTEAGAMGET